MLVVQGNLQSHNQIPLLSAVRYMATLSLLHAIDLNNRSFHDCNPVPQRQGRKVSLTDSFNWNSWFHEEDSFWSFHSTSQPSNNRYAFLYCDIFSTAKTVTLLSRNWDRFLHHHHFISWIKERTYNNTWSNYSGQLIENVRQSSLEKEGLHVVHNRFWIIQLSF